MRINARGFTLSTLLMLPAIVLVLAVTIANAQTTAGASTQEQVATAANTSTSTTATANVPIFKGYRGVSIGMSADEVRSKLDGIKKGKDQDFLSFSDRESAQIYYDDEGKVTAISVDFFGANSNAPSPDTVLGVVPQAKADGSLYQLNRYPQAGFWVSYNRTAGDKPIVTITLQKMKL